MCPPIACSITRMGHRQPGVQPSAAERLLMGHSPRLDRARPVSQTVFAAKSACRTFEPSFSRYGGPCKLCAPLDGEWGYCKRSHRRQSHHDLTDYHKIGITLAGLAFPTGVGALRSSALPETPFRRALPFPGGRPQKHPHLTHLIAKRS